MNRNRLGVALVCCGICGYLFWLSGCITEKFIRTSDGIPLAYDYREIPNEKGVAVLLHGLGSDLNEWHSLRKYLNKNGWSTLAIDLRGHGFSNIWNDEPISWKHFTVQGFLTALRDVEAAVDFVGRERNLWIIGSSFGANLGLLYATQEAAVRGLVLLSPGFYYAGIAAEPAIKHYGKRPLLIAGAEDDPGTPKICKILYDRAENPKRLLSYDQGGHGTVMLDFVEGLKKEILQWINQETINPGQRPIKK